MEHIYSTLYSNKFLRGKIYMAKTMAEYHLGMKDYNGDPVYLHAFRMASALDIREYDEDYIIAAILHDILEDGSSKKIPLELEISFGEKVFEAIKIVTKSESDTYFEYIQKVIDSKNQIAIRVKQIDIYDHLYHTESLPDSLKERYLKAADMLGLKEKFYETDKEK